MPAFILTWEQDLQGALFPARVATVALGVMGTLGALLAVTGIFGMAAYSVSKRLKELGIRLALGARSKQVLQAGLGRALKLLAFGSAAGMLLGVLSTRIRLHRLSGDPARPARPRRRRPRDGVARTPGGVDSRAPSALARPGPPAPRGVD
jgi:predicted lysophospholipase L1 biosynthesis ABC-type transport system permease subunit